MACRPRPLSSLRLLGTTMSDGRFRAGTDPRRNVRSGRPPSGPTIATLVRAELGTGDLRGRLQQLRLLADAGDPGALVATATLLAAVARARGDAGK